MRSWRIALLTVIPLASAVGLDAHAATRVPIPAETGPRNALVGLSAGDSHTCQLLADGTVRCWGSNGFGQLGDGTLSDAPLPVRVQSVINALAVTAGRRHTCALLSDGTARCWGGNNAGQLGDGTTTTTPRPIAVRVSGLTNAVAIVAGEFHTCALLANGTARCWGSNTFGPLGIGSTRDSATPAPVSNLTDARAIAAGSQHTCAIRADSSVRCWGANFQGQLGDTTATSRFAPVAVSTLTNAVAITAGSQHTCTVQADGTARCWGDNLSGQLGDGTNADRAQPVPVSSLTNAVAITAGGVHTCARRADGSARCWGNNVVGQLGDATNTFRAKPFPVVGFTGAIALAAGSHHTCGSTADHAVACWGLNDEGQLGNGTVSNSSVAQTVAGGGGGISATAITSGFNHTCALRASASASCWGDNSVGQLGDGTLDDRPLPTAVMGLTNAVAISTQNGHTCALTADGTARCWGNNSGGQLGDSTFGGNHPSPNPVVGLTNAVAIAASFFYTCALIADGTVRCWGDNSEAQLGDGTVGGRRPLPVAVTGLTNAVTIAVGARHACALIADGTARCWGSNANGQLGNGSVGGTDPLPGTIIGLTNAVAIAAGVAHTCALIVDGTARCWGTNLSGQLGIGSFGGDRPLPDTVIGLTNAVVIGAAGGFQTCALTAVGTARCWGVVSTDGVAHSLPVAVTDLTNTFVIGVGNLHTCAIKATGAVFCWGSNDQGELGDGTTDDSPAPVAVPSFTLNIDPRVELHTHGRFATVTILANCPEGQWLEVHVTLRQGATTAHGFGLSACELGLARYPLTVVDLRRDTLHVGPAEVEADAVIWNRFAVADRQEWTRAVAIVDEQ